MQKDLGSYQRRTFLKDHPPVLDQVLLGSEDEEEPTTLLAGTVLGFDDDEKKYYPWKKGLEASCILAEDVTVPAVGDQYASVYVHAAVVRPLLTWGDGVSAADQKDALEQLRAKGIYLSEV